MYAYASEDPLSDLDVSFMNNRHGARPTYLIHKSQHQHLGPSTAANLPADLRTWELRNVEVAFTAQLFFLFCFPFKKTTVA